MSLFRLIAGIVGGTALGLLFANKTGKNLREQMKGKSSKEIAEILGKEFLTVGKDVKKTVEESKDVQDLMKKGKKELSEAVETVKKNVKKKAPAVKKQVKKATDQAKKQVKKVVDKVSQ